MGDATAKINTGSANAGAMARTKAAKKPPQKPAAKPGSTLIADETKLSTQASAKYRIETADGAPLTAAAGDVLRLKVVQVKPDGSSAPLPPEAKVSWSGVTTVVAAKPGTELEISKLPAAGKAPVGIFVQNPARLDHKKDLDGALFILSRGTMPKPTIQVSASISGVEAQAEVTGTVSVSSLMYKGDPVQGAKTFRANCSSCHGEDGEGKYGPTLNMSGLIGEGIWDSAMLAMAARSNVDDMGVALARPMVNWMSTKASNDQLLTGQDFANIFSFLGTKGEKTKDQ